MTITLDVTKTVTLGTDTPTANVSVTALNAYDYEMPFVNEVIKAVKHLAANSPHKGELKEGTPK